MKKTAWFNEIPDAELALAAGGKGASLCRMYNAGLSVPEGFIVRAEMFTEFMTKSGLFDEVMAAIDKIDFSSTADLVARAEEIRTRICREPMPADMEAEIKDYYAHFDGSPVAVRSSGTAEDLDDASFAGQQETYLFVIGENDVIKYIRECWASLYNDRAIFYRREKGFDERDISIAVVVQRMVDAEKAGVMFTANPIDGNRDVAIIEAAWGLGEGVVSGIVTPDNLWINKKTRETVEEYIAEKETMVVRLSKEGGTKELDVPEDIREAPVLSHEEQMLLIDAAIKIEEFYGKPEDIEWAFNGGKLYILQSRPITTL